MIRALSKNLADNKNIGGNEATRTFVKAKVLPQRSVAKTKIKIGNLGEGALKLFIKSLFNLIIKTRSYLSQGAIERKLT